MAAGGLELGYECMHNYTYKQQNMGLYSSPKYSIQPSSESLLCSPMTVKKDLLRLAYILSLQGAINDLTCHPYKSVFQRQIIMFLLENNIIINDLHIHCSTTILPLTSASTRTLPHTFTQHPMFEHSLIILEYNSLPNTCVTQGSISTLKAYNLLIRI